MAVTRAQLNALVRPKLNDASKGNYSDTELNAIITAAVTATEQVAKCNLATVTTSSITTNPLDPTPLFEVLDVYCAAARLDIISFLDLPGLSATWPATAATDAAGTKRYWWQQHGLAVGYYPKVATGKIFTIYGYGTSVPMVADSGATGSILTIPDGFANTFLVDRIEAGARLARPRVPGNIALAGVLLAQWRAACPTIQVGAG